LRTPIPDKQDQSKQDENHGTAVVTKSGGQWFPHQETLFELMELISFWPLVNGVSMQIFTALSHMQKLGENEHDNDKIC
jgi:hypothetical protein